MSNINASNKVNVKELALAGQRVIKVINNGVAEYHPVGLSSLNPNGGAGDSTVKFGYWTADGKFQEVDLSGDTPVDSGEPITVDAVTFKTGKPTPDYPTTGGGGSMEFYKCASYDDGETIPAYSNLTLSGITSHEDANGDYIALDITAEGTERKWTNGDYTIANKENVWYIYPSTVVPNKMLALYYAEVLPATAEDGTEGNPQYWDSIVTEDRTITPTFSTGDYESSEFKRNIYVKLLAGTQYKLGIVNESGIDANILLYDLAGELIDAGDDSGADINGISCTDSITYTPGSTGIYRVACGAYSSASGNIQVVCYPAPEVAEAPTKTEPWELDWIAGGAEEGAYIITGAGYAPAIGEYTPSTETFDGNTLWTNEDTGAVWKATPNGSNWRWYLYGNATSTSYIYYESSSSLTNATPWDNSDKWTHSSSSYLPYPTFSRGTGKTVGNLAISRVDIAERPATGKQVWTGYKATQSEESQKWVFADAITNNLEVKGVTPIVGRIYSADTTVQVENVVEDMSGRMLCLAHFDTNVKTGTSTSDLQGGIVFMDGTETCLIRITPQACIYYQAKFGAGSFYGNNLRPEYPQGVFTVIGMPAIEGDFTVEFWHYYKGYVEPGGLILYITKWNQDNYEYEKIAELNAVKTPVGHPQRKLQTWFHHAFVRQGSIVTEYIDGVKVADSEFTATLGGEYYLHVAGGGTIGSDARNSIDEFAIFDYARYTQNFAPPYSPYPDVPSGVNTPNTDVRQVSVSGIKSIPWANSQSYALVNSSATGNSRVWVTSDGKWYIWFDEGNRYGWVIANSTSWDEPDYIEAAYISISGEQYTINPIGHSGWVDANDNKVKVKVKQLREPDTSNDNANNGDLVPIRTIQLAGAGTSEVDGTYTWQENALTIQQASGTLTLSAFIGNNGYCIHFMSSASAVDISTLHLASRTDPFTILYTCSRTSYYNSGKQWSVASGASPAPKTK